MTFIAMIFFPLAMFVEQDVNPWSTYLNYPCAEIWKFTNLFIFVGIGVYLLLQRLADALHSRREGLKQELLKAREERDGEQPQHNEMQSKYERLNAEDAATQQSSRPEAAAERE